MATRIRLARRGRKKLAMYDVVVADARAPRDGRFIEKLGTYNPNTNPASIVLNDDKTFDWVMTGAEPSDTVKAILSYRGIMLRKHLQVGVGKGAITQEQADEKFEEWKASKDSKIQTKVDSLSATKDSAAKARFEAETKANAARILAIQAKQVVPEVEVVEEAVEATVEEAKEEVVKAEVAEPAVETVKEEAPVQVVAEEVKEAPVAEKVEEVAAEEVPAKATTEEAPSEEDKKEA